MTGERANIFTPPERKRPGRRSDRLTAKAVKSWVGSLPVANVGQTAHQLYERLSQLNRLDLPVGERREIMEALREPLDLTLRALGRHYADQALPLKGRPALVARLSRELLTMTVQGYRIIDDELSAQPALGRTLAKGRRAAALHRKLQYLGRLVLHNYELYRKQPPGVWLEVHDSYRRAVAEGLQTRPVTDADSAAEGRSTVADAYKQILLLALAGPYRLLQGDVGRVFEAVREWAPLCRLEPPVDAPDAAGLYGIDPGRDSPPFLRAQNGELPPAGWILNTDQLARELDDLLQERRRAAPDPLPGAPRPSDAPDALSDEILERLALSWGLGATRRAERTAVGGSVRVVCGMDGVLGLFGDHYAAAAQPPTPREPSPGAGDMPEWASGQPSEDIALGGPTPASWAAGPGGGGTEHRCQIVDRGPAGYQLRVADPCERAARVGDLMGLCDDRAGSDGGRWRIGVIRWVNAQSQDDVQMGVEVLADKVRPVVLRHIRLAPRGEERLASLLLEGAGGQP
ncbi:MAG: hypothetical protein PVF91_16195, partial [Chromatiales bacterium]